LRTRDATGRQAAAPNALRRLGLVLTRLKNPPAPGFLEESFFGDVSEASWQSAESFALEQILIVQP
jgi:hypothetical protein